MSVRNTKNSYGSFAKILHWAIAVFILSLLFVGFYMGSMPDSPDKYTIYSFHKSLGLLVLWLVFLRILWRAYTKPPLPNSQHRLWEKGLAKLIHVLLYVAMIAMPLSGWVMSSAAGYPVAFFGLSMPDIVPKNLELAGLANKMHGFFAYLIVGAVLFHVVGALKHHILDRDDTFLRMMPSSFYKLWQICLILIIVVCGVGILKFGFLNKMPPQQEINQVELSDLVIEKSDVSEKNALDEWRIVKQQSNIEFQATLYDKEFTGRFSNFDGQIIFDPQNLVKSTANIQINLKSVSTGQVERDAELLGGEWFNVADNPNAVFQTIEFQHIEDNRYVAVGNLTLAGKTMPISFPFILDIVPDDTSQRAYVSGAFRLNRFDFGLGENQWATGDKISSDVQVKIRLVAEK